MLEAKKMVLVALNAKYIHSNLAIYSLRAYAKKEGQTVHCLEYTINQPFDEVLAGIFKSRPDVLCFSCYIWNIAYVRELVTEYRKLCPDVPIWLGGPEVSYEAEHFLEENPAVTGLMLGEGEETFAKLCRFYQEEGEDLFAYCDKQEIDGLAWRRAKQNGADGEWECVVLEKKRVLSMDELPFCYENLEDMEHRIIYYESSRGCPFSCSYCLSSVDKHLRLRSLDLVYKELDFFLEHQVPQVKFVDRTFNCNHAHAMGIWQYILEHDNGVTNFHFEISADLLTREECALLAKMRPGLVQFEIGVQTVNDKTLTEIRRKMDLSRLTEVVQEIKSNHNIHQHLDLIAGLPYEDYDSFKNSFDEVYRMYGEQLQLGFLKVLKGSYMYEMAEEYGLQYRDKPPYEVLQTRWLTYREMLCIKKVEEMLEIHYNSGQYQATMALLGTCFDSPFELYLKLGEFYEDKGYRNGSYGRLSRVMILHEFVSVYDKELLPLYEEALIHDLYLREKAKSRPVFAHKEAEDSKEITRRLIEAGCDRKYCHVEFYNYPVWEIKADINRCEAINLIRIKQNQWVIYNYEKKENKRASLIFCKEKGEDE